MADVHARPHAFALTRLLITTAIGAWPFFFLPAIRPETDFIPWAPVAAVGFVVAVVGLVTIALSAYMILYSDPLYRFCRGLGILKVFGAAQVEDEEPALEFQQHVVVIGMNALGKGLSRALHERGESSRRDRRPPADLQVSHVLAGYSGG